MTNLIQECGLVNTHLLQDSYSKIEIYARGKENIDYVFTTQRIQQCAVYAYTAPYNEWIISVYRVLVVDNKGIKLKWLEE